MARVRFWVHILLDVARSATREHLDPLRRGPGFRGRRGSALESWLHEVRLAVRGHAKRPGLSLVMIATMAVAIGGATTLFSVIHGVLLAPLPYAQSGELVRVGAGFTAESGRLYALSMPEASHLDERSRAFESMAVTRAVSVTLRGEGEPEIHGGAMVSWRFFEVLGVRPALGRFFAPEDDLPGAEPVAVLDHGLWTQRFGADESIIGETVPLGPVPFTVIGVLPPSFRAPEALVSSQTKLWISLCLLDEEKRRDPKDHFLGGIARLSPGTSVAAAQAELRDLDARYVDRLGRAEPSHFGVASLQAETVGDVAGALLPLFGAVALLLLIACANTATLLLIRAGERRDEMAVRSALGGARVRLVRQLLTESLLIGVAGGLLGTFLAFAGVDLFKAFSPDSIPRLAEVSIDRQVLVFSLAATLVASLLFGLAPALRGSSDLWLRTGARAAAGLGRGKSALVIVEVAVAFVLVVGASLLIHSFLRLHQVELGFDPESAYVLGVSGPAVEAPEQASSFYRELEQRLESLPGAVAVGATSNLPMGGRYAMWSIKQVDGRPPPVGDPDDRGYSLFYQYVTPGFFDALDIEQLRGRDFGPADDGRSRPVAVLNEAAARDLFGEDGVDEAVGRRLQASDGYEDTWFEVIGVVADTRQHRLEREAGAELYLSYDQARHRPSLDVVVRTERPIGGLLAAMRAELRALRADVPVRRAVYLPDFIADSAASPRFYTLVLGTFAAVALLLALVGVQGTLSYAVSRRRREIGIRMALGAGGGPVLAMVLRRGVALVGGGLALGMAGAVATTRFLESLVFGITPTDLPTLALCTVAVAAVSVGVTLIPAWRASKISPLDVLKKT
ncbi:MAG: ABC transporter permease [Acidobacteriota bacterium]